MNLTPQGQKGNSIEELMVTLLLEDVLLHWQGGGGLFDASESAVWFANETERRTAILLSQGEVVGQLKLIRDGFMRCLSDSMLHSKYEAIEGWAKRLEEFYESTHLREVDDIASLYKNATVLATELQNAVKNGLLRI